MKRIRKTLNWLLDMNDWKLLLRSIPSLVTSLFILSVVVMNLLANRELINICISDGPLTGVGLALDCGFTLSWISFLCMDMICKRFGPKASTKISILALAVNLGLTLIFNLIMLTPGNWAAAYNDALNTDNINAALNSTFAGTWYVVVGSSVAMLIASIANSFLNNYIGKLMRDNDKKTTYKKFAVRSFISTGIAQFIDNFIFATLVSKIFFGWTWWQVGICSLTGALMELVCEIILSPLGFKVVLNWQNENVGKEYLGELSDR